MLTALVIGERSPGEVCDLSDVRQTAAEHGDPPEAAGGVAGADPGLLPPPPALHARSGRESPVAALLQRRHQT